MKYNRIILITILGLLAAGLGACASENGTILTSEEESGPELALGETYDTVRAGARLILVYDAESNSFIGTAENTTDNTLKQVRVEVHLSNGVELGPTTATDLAPGEKIGVVLKVANTGFDGWTAHPEVGESEGGEHGSSDGEGEHGEEGESEHNEGGSD